MVCLKAYSMKRPNTIHVKARDQLPRLISNLLNGCANMWFSFVLAPPDVLHQRLRTQADRGRNEVVPGAMTRPWTANKNWSARAVSRGAGAAIMCCHAAERTSLGWMSWKARASPLCPLSPLLHGTTLPIALSPKSVPPIRTIAV